MNQIIQPPSLVCLLKTSEYGDSLPQNTCFTSMFFCDFILIIDANDTKILPRHYLCKPDFDEKNDTLPHSNNSDNKCCVTSFVRGCFNYEADFA